METWDNTYHNISIRLTEHLIQVKTDEALMSYLGQKGNDSIPLAGYIRAAYEEKFHTPLQITEDSLAIEILIHAYIDVYSRKLEKCGDKLPAAVREALVKCLDKVEERTEVIDCGEKEVDPNRFVFDGLQPFKKLVYQLLE